LNELDAWITQQCHIEPLLDETRHFIHTRSDLDIDEWSSTLFISDVPAGKEEESEEALALDDSKERAEIAKLAGITSIPERGKFDANDLVGLFDSIAPTDENVDVTQWVRQSRRSY
jgi:hypothetical protein